MTTNRDKKNAIAVTMVAMAEGMRFGIFPNIRWHFFCGRLIPAPLSKAFVA